MDASESGSSHKRQKTSGAEKDLDCSNASRGVWLVKVPKYISQIWEKAPPLAEAGRLKIASPFLTFCSPNDSELYYRVFGLVAIISQECRQTKSSDDMLKTPDGKVKNDVPKNHRFVISNIAHQTLAVFASENGDSSSSSGDPGKLFLGGHVLQKGECRPLPDQNYMKLKKESILKASQPERKAIQLMKVVTNYKPVSDHKHNIEYEQKKKAEGRKARDDKDKVMDMLFAAFEKHQYYNIKDLEKITRQPIPYLKEILKEICNYNAKNPHKSMWELKPEYRHYKDSENPE